MGRASKAKRKKRLNPNGEKAKESTSLIENKNLLTVGDLAPFCYKHFGKGFFIYRQGYPLVYETNRNLLNENKLDKAIFETNDFNKRCIIIYFSDSDDGFSILSQEEFCNATMRINAPRNFDLTDLNDKQKLLKYVML
jgi:hypothetical protein